jgi:lysophospholipase L1-like esterase
MSETNVLIIKTIGDSLTEGSVREAMIGTHIELPNTYQYWLYKGLQRENIDAEVHNLGIGGQIIHEICGRFQLCVPADVIVTMGGTNDIGRFGDYASDVGDDIAQTIIDEYSQVVLAAESNQMDEKGYLPLILINSVPPFGATKVNTPNRHRAIEIVNQRVREWIETLGHPNVMYCDVYGAMADEEGYARPELVVADGVHFTIKGNQTVAETNVSRILDAIALNTVHFS